jgi:hypothetical protein
MIATECECALDASEPALTHVEPGCRFCAASNGRPASLQGCGAGLLTSFATTNRSLLPESEPRILHVLRLLQSFGC